MFAISGDELLGKELNQFIVPEGLESEGNDLDTLISSYQSSELNKPHSEDGKGTFGDHLARYPSPLLNETTIGIFGVYVDITEIKNWKRS